MTIDQKLKLNSLVVLVLLAVSVAVAVFFIDRMQRDVRQLVEVEEPLEQAILEMEINVGETARAVLDYIRDFDEQALDRIRDSERDFERFARQFERLAETEEERALGKEIAFLSPVADDPRKEPTHRLQAVTLKRRGPFTPSHARPDSRARPGQRDAGPNLAGALRRYQ